MENTEKELWDRDMKALDLENHRILMEMEAANKEALEYVKNNINYPFKLITDSLEDITWNHHNYVEVIKSDYKSGMYPSYTFYKIKDDKEFIDYMRQDESDDFHYMVYQLVGYFGDDYSGYQLFPLKDGRYWKISFNC